MTHYAVDDVEGGLARLERNDGRVVLFPLELLPEGTRSGDVLALERFVAGGQTVNRWWRDEGERRRRVARARAILDRLAVDDDGGDVKL